MAFQDAFHRRQESELYAMRLSFLISFCIIGSLILILRLAYLQFYEYQKLSRLAFKNQITTLPLAPSRGIIFDRNGVILANNIPVYSLEIIPEKNPNLTQTIHDLQQLIPSITQDDIENFHKIRQQHRKFIPIPLKIQLSSAEVATFASHQYQYPNVHISARLLRYYPFKAITAHVLGYVGRINAEELKTVDHLAYRGTNFIGKAGIERYYEPLLHGKVGYQHHETHVSGRVLRILKKVPPISGQSLYLTLDIRLQKVAYKAMKNKKGSVVLMRAQGGEILAMVSMPSFNPNLFVKGIPQKTYQAWLSSDDRPLYHRAVQGLYPPASPVKPFIALAALDQGYATPTTKIYDPGWYQLPGVQHFYRDWKRGGHGWVNMKRAITVSCDTYFYHLSHTMGIKPIETILKQFGLGQWTHIDLKEDTQGLVPGPEWKRRVKGLPWYPGDTLITSIGQGFMLASPLQLANATATLSQKGQRFQPHLRLKSVSDTGKVTPFHPIQTTSIQLKHPEIWSFITESMEDVIQHAEGTAGSRFGRNAPYRVAGKTGTAQVFTISQDEKKRNQAVIDKLRDHSLLIAFAPVEHPEVAIAVITEHDHDAPIIARQVLDAYFNFTAKEPYDSTF